MYSIVYPLIICAVALGAAFLFRRLVMREPMGTERMVEIHTYIREGAYAFMIEEAKVFLFVMLGLSLFLLWLFGWEVGVAFLIGALFSGTAGFIGMDAATQANVRTANAARSGFNKALKVAFSGGSVMGLAVGGLALGGLCLVLLFFRDYFIPTSGSGNKVFISNIPIPFLGNVNLIKGAVIVSAYSMGASLVALFDRVGGGIYTKAADMGADLVGKVEAKIPEDDPRNPATIADNVGDNVGDVGGLGADLLESFVGAIISIIVMLLYLWVGARYAIESNLSDSEILKLLSCLDILNITEPNISDFNLWNLILLSVFIAAGGIIACLIGILFIRFNPGQNPQRILMNGKWVSAGFTILFAGIITYLFPTNMVPFYATALGIISGIAIGFLSEYFTSDHFSPVQRIAKGSQSGPAITVTSGLAVGMESTLFPVLILSAATIISYQLGGLIAVSFSAMGMLSFVVMTVSIDSYGPIADNASGITEMSGLGQDVRERTDRLDSVGNTTAAIGKGFAIGSAAFAALGLFAAYIWSAAGSAEEVRMPNIGLLNVDVGAFVIAGLFVGAMIPYVFSALLIRAVSSTADLMIVEIRRQFREKPGILKGKDVPDYRRCIGITSHAGLKKMFLPAILAIITPFLIGLIFGRWALAGVLVGTLLSCIQLAIQCANSGGAMDNAKKYIEQGHYGGKGSETHAAGVIGDTVGDPLKDTVGPSLDILVKLMCVTSLLFASLFPLKPIFIK
ncbi:MAG: sodium-translocating pyrophosphatase [bacterium]|nr:sodium-translocating pyrophosphatase [bacterium]